MKRLLAGACALGLAGAGLAGLASPGSAGEAPSEPEVEIIQLEAVLNPAEPEVGDSYTITPVEACAVADAEDPGELYWFLGSFTTGEIVAEDVIPVDADGNWDLAFEAENAEDLYFYAECYPPGAEDRYDVCFPEDPEEEVTGPDDLSAATNENTTTTVEPTTTTTVVEDPVNCTFEYYELEYTIGDPPPPAPTPPAKPIPGKPIFFG